MLEGYVTALAALGGSIVGSLTSLTTTFFSQRVQSRVDRANKELAKREALYGQFIDEASRLYVEVMEGKTDEATKFAPIGALLNRTRLFAGDVVQHAAEEVMASLIRLNAQPGQRLRELDENKARLIMMPLETFSKACRDELGGVQ